MAENTRLHAIVSGHVQGVGFRYFVLRNAQSLGLKGWVRNLAHGEVEVLAEGRQEVLQDLLEALWTGPSSGHVRDVRSQWLQASGEFTSFNISF